MTRYRLFMFILRASLNHQMAGGAVRCCGCGCWQRLLGGVVFSTSEAEALTVSEQMQAAGGLWPQMVFYLLCFHTEPPSSGLREAALRACSDPPDLPLSMLMLSLSFSLSLFELIPGIYNNFSETSFHLYSLYHIFPLKLSVAHFCLFLLQQRAT